MEKDFSFGKFTLSTLFVLGDCALYLPYKTASKGVLVALAGAVFMSVAFYFFWYFLADKMFTLKKKTAVVYIYCAAVIFAGVFSSGVTSISFIGYLSDEILIKSVRFILTLVFAALVFYVIISGEKSLTKFSVLSFIYCVLCIVIMFLISIKNFNSGYFSDTLRGKAGDILNQTLYIFLRSFSSTAIFATFSRFAFSERKIKYDICGIFTGSIFLILCLLSGVLTFSLKTASGMRFAYPTSIGVINIGNLLTRMDGFTYFLFFFSCLVKTAICGLTVKLMLNKSGVQKSGIPAGFLTVSSLLISYIL